MINNNLLEQINKYNPRNLLETKNAIKETLQDIILCGLSKANFFNNIAFYGGTSLRIFRNLPRFSEDLDFTFFNNQNNFNFSIYLDFVLEFLHGYGLILDYIEKEKNINSTVKTAYLNFSLKEILSITFPNYIKEVDIKEKISIKVEIETNYIENPIIENKLLTYPNFSLVKTFDMPTLFASKTIAILGRNWNNRVKGRDFYDYLFYIDNKTPININFLKNGLKIYRPELYSENYNLDTLKSQLFEKFSTINFNDAKNDVIPFIKTDDKYFLAFNKDIFLASIDSIYIK